MAGFAPKLSFEAKRQELKKLLTEGKYKQALLRIMDGVLKINSRKLKYLYLKKKYSAFIAERVADNLRNRGGVKLLTRPISYGGYGFRA